MTGQDVTSPHVLREYSLIADGERGAVIGPQGDVAWMCFPSWESPAIFGGLVGTRGRYSVHPGDEWRVWGGYYEEGSLIWRSRWVTGDGVVECRQALALPARRDRAVLLRRLKAVRGRACFRAHLEPHAGFGADKVTGLRAEDGVWSARSGPVHLHWTGAAQAAENGGGLVLELELAEPAGRQLEHLRRAPDDDRIDASLLIPPVRGALPADDPRTVATLDAVRDQLVDDGFVYRYQIDDRPLGAAEGAFMLCGFFLALAEQQQGRTAQAVRRFERIRSGCGTTGLFTEEYDIRQRQLRANLPQALVHALFLETAARLGVCSA
ncbi:hypothetical protein GCM10023195_50210 [Actinoallomurus liliacearum]|uniref:Uncharacterized protein n=1 Tax=Actinoallomurus liliacearum TaxID=1080073 RepID=A0ABP8TRE1_9ACTN